MYHPGVLATLAPYNAEFGDRFHTLFEAAADEIRNFSRQLEELGGSILSTVDGVEVTVDHIAALDEKALFRFDYGSALEKFRRISRLRKELERRPPVRRSQPTAPRAAQSQARPVGAGGAAAAPAPETHYVPAAVTAQARSAEEAKLRRVEESIRIFVRVADPKFRQIVPMRYFNLMLSPAEVEAYTADYLEQASPRADSARLLLRIVSLTARLTTELEELKRSPRANTVWKLHADSLNVLLDLSKHMPEAVHRLPATDESTTGLRSSLEKLTARMSEIEKLIGAA